MYSQQQQRYLSEAVQTASPAARLVMIYDRLLLDLNRAEKACQQGDVADAHYALVHAQQIVGVLSDTLDMSVWEGAQNLHDLYEYIYGELITANLNKDASTVGNAISVVRPLAAAWHEGSSDPGRRSARGADQWSGLSSSGSTRRRCACTRSGWRAAASVSPLPWSTPRGCGDPYRLSCARTRPRSWRRSPAWRLPSPASSSPCAGWPGTRLRYGRGTTSVRCRATSTRWADQDPVLRAFSPWEMMGRCIADIGELRMGRPFLPDEDRPLRDVVADALRTAILTGDLQPGTRVPEEQLASDKGVSRVPVREALQMLAAEGFVVLSPRRGATVASPGAEKALELMEIRRSLELLAVRRAAEARGGKQASDLTRVVRQAERAVTAGQLNKLPSLVDEFHGLLTAASGNEELVDVLANLRLRVSWMFSVDLDTRSVAAWDEHAAILSCVLEGDREGAERLMDVHVRHDEMLLRAKVAEQAISS